MPMLPGIASNEQSSQYLTNVHINQDILTSVVNCLGMIRCSESLKSEASKFFRLSQFLSPVHLEEKDKTLYPN